MDRVRDPHTTYRVDSGLKCIYIVETPGMPTPSALEPRYEITKYPRKPADLTRQICRFDAMPEWMQEAIHLLDWGTEVHGIGRKVGEIYWIEPVDK